MAACGDREGLKDTSFIGGSDDGVKLGFDEGDIDGSTLGKDVGFALGEILGSVDGL